MRKLLSLLLIVGSVTFFCGCESGSSSSSSSSGSSDVTFVNSSSFNVTITPNGQPGWEAFLISPGQERAVDIGEPLFYVFAPSRLVQSAESSSGSVVTFTNIPNPE